MGIPNLLLISILVSIMDFLLSLQLCLRVLFFFKQRKICSVDVSCIFGSEIPLATIPERFNIIFFVTSYFAKQICFKEGFMAEKKNNLEKYNYPKADAIVIDSYHISSSYMSSLKKNYFLTKSDFF